LWIAFPYNFHKETIDARKNRIVIEQVLEDIFGHKLRLQTALERDLKEETPVKSGEGDLMKEAIKVLGGN